MIERVDTDAPPSLTSLAAGIVDDLRLLVRQEVTLARQEVRQEVVKAITAVAWLAIGGVLLAFSGLLFVAMLVFLLHWATNNQLPLWSCFGVVGGVIAIIGVVLLLIGKWKVDNLHLVPPRTAETLKENFAWIQNQK